ncbi:ATP-binding protein [Streptosporangium amethystogenes subsp. fukuiense]|uniref:ATP-binding protein n=1 Tax=Streptosporangium amethystogenes subsp. fukuiense TaxID=698418 RepID=A0ABW2SS06_9ACTN
MYGEKVRKADLWVGGKGIVMQPIGKSAEIFLRREVESVSRARELVLDLLGADHPAYEQVRLAVSEITTNAVEHSESGPVGDLVMVVLKVVDDFVRIEVTDPGSESSKPHIRENQSTNAEDGRGLFIVNQLSSGNWGIRDFGAGGRTVWCAIPANPSGSDEIPMDTYAIPAVQPEA